MTLFLSPGEYCQSAMGLIDEICAVDSCLPRLVGATKERAQEDRDTRIDQLAAACNSRWRAGVHLTVMDSNLSRRLENIRFVNVTSGEDASMEYMFTADNLMVMPDVATYTWKDIVENPALVKFDGHAAVLPIITDKNKLLFVRPPGGELYIISNSYDIRAMPPFPLPSPV